MGRKKGEKNGGRRGKGEERWREGGHEEKKVSQGAPLLYCALPPRSPGTEPSLAPGDRALPGHGAPVLPTPSWPTWHVSKERRRGESPRCPQLHRPCTGEALMGNAECLQGWPRATLVSWENQKVPGQATAVNPPCSAPGPWWARASGPQVGLDGRAWRDPPVTSAGVLGPAETQGNLAL